MVVAENIQKPVHEFHQKQAGFLERIHPLPVPVGVGNDMQTEFLFPRTFRFQKELSCIIYAFSFLNALSFFRRGRCTSIIFCMSDSA